MNTVRISLSAILFFEQIPVYSFLTKILLQKMASGTASGTISCCMRDLMMTITKGILLAVILPLVPVFIFNISLPSALALITGTFVIEYGAAALGVGMGLHPLYILYTLTFVALGVTLTMFDVFNLLGRHSERVSRFLKNSSDRAGNSAFLKKYGIYGLVPCVMTLGFYACPPVSWVMGWSQNRSIVLIMGGYIIISIVTILATMGFLKIVGIG
jgi:hypothetical protein